MKDLQKYNTIDEYLRFCKWEHLKPSNYKSLLLFEDFLNYAEICLSKGVL
jgi:hypothetical protein